MAAEAEAGDGAAMRTIDCQVDLDAEEAAAAGRRAEHWWAAQGLEVIDDEEEAGNFWAERE